MIKGIYKELSVIGILVAWVATRFYHYLTNQFTAGGDGSRIYPNVNFFDTQESLFPLWNSFKLGGGTPILAEPESYQWLSWLLNSDDVFYNLKFNLLLLAMGVILLRILYNLFRSFEFNEITSLVGVFVFAHSDAFFNYLQFGRINTALEIIAILSSLLFLIAYHKHGRGINIICAVLSLSVAMYVGWHYAFLIYGVLSLPVMFYLMKSEGKSELYYMKSVASIGIMSFILVLPFFVILMLYLKQDYVGDAAYLSIVKTLPEPGNVFSLFNVAPDFIKQRDVYFLRTNHLVIPLLLSFIFFYKKKDHDIAGILVIISSCSLLIIFGKIGFLSPLIDLYNHVPILNGVRHSNVYYLFLFFSVSILSMYGFRSVSDRFVMGEINNTLTIVAILSITLLLLFVDVHLDAFYTLAAWVQGRVELVVVAIALFYSALFLLLRHGREDYYKYVFLGGVVLLTVTIPFITNGKFERVYAENNRGIDQSIKDILDEDESYFSVYNYRHQSVDIVDTVNIRSSSTYMPPAYRQLLYHLYNKKHLSNLPRPSWIFRHKMTAPLNDNILKLLNVKYFYYKPEHIHSEFMANLKFLGESHNDYTLYEYRNWQQQLRLFSNVRLEADPDKVLDNLSNNYTDYAYVEKRIDLNSDVLPLDYDIDRVVVSDNIEKYIVKSNRDALIQIPKFFDEYWTVKVNGKEVEALRVNGVYIGTLVNKGNNVVEVHYKPLIFYYALVVSWAVLLSLYILYYAYKKKRT